MPRKPRIDFVRTAEQVRLHLTAGPSTAAGIINRLGLSQSTFSRLKNRFSSDILAAGSAEGTRYARRRSIPDVGSSIPIYRIDESGKTARHGSLHAIEPKGFYFETGATGRSRFFEDLPYFLDDLRPNGFLGRLIPKQHPRLDLPQDIVAWSTDTCLRYLTRFGADLIGDFILGDEAFRLYLAHRSGPPETIAADRRATIYPIRAADVLRFGDPGSSAGGEQPKFAALVGHEKKPVLVKFSPQASNDVTRRRADLLVCEHVCLETLRAHGHPAAESELVRAQDQVFLQVARFDRTASNGRKGLISMRAVDAGLIGSGGAWSMAAERMRQEGFITKETLDQIRWRELFGHLIGNTDMHQANISFYFQDPDILGLAPAYDMLPMLFSPRNDQLVEVDFIPPAPHPKDADIWSGACAAAADFWRSVQEDSRISSGFKAIARVNHERIQPLSRLQDLLPPPTS